MGCSSTKSKITEWRRNVLSIEIRKKKKYIKLNFIYNFQEKAWKRKIDKVTFVGENFTRKPPKYERFIRPTGLRFKKANVTHPELKTTF